MFSNCDYFIWYGGALYVYEDSYTYEYAQLNDVPYKFIMTGDVNCDGEINILDVTSIQLHIAKLELLYGSGLANADVNKDGNVSILDATQIQLFIAQLIPEL